MSKLRKFDIFTKSRNDNDLSSNEFKYLFLFKKHLKYSFLFSFFFFINIYNILLTQIPIHRQKFVKIMNICKLFCRLPLSYHCCGMITAQLLSIRYRVTSVDSGQYTTEHTHTMNSHQFVQWNFMFSGNYCSSNSQYYFRIVFVFADNCLGGVLFLFVVRTPKHTSCSMILQKAAVTGSFNSLVFSEFCMRLKSTIQHKTTFFNIENNYHPHNRNCCILYVVQPSSFVIIKILLSRHYMYKVTSIVINLTFASYNRVYLYFLKMCATCEYFIKI
ncbi:hypothetical protein AGLY_005991 [Aphis glycines]|uniref:Uncharacterized protein n=1 Tax=Aphis glycines TaxID=307491 RepID=A0A6G0TTR7_APHGL|nr:hypothetical protein AGLY_005991 [Aphis glycines]